MNKSSRKNKNSSNICSKNNINESGGSKINSSKSINDNYIDDIRDSGASFSLNEQINNPEDFLDEVKKTLKNRMQDDLFSHSMGTNDYSLMLLNIQLKKMSSKNENTADIFFGNKYLPEPQLKELTVKLKFVVSAAALLHDYGKIFSYQGLISLIEKNKIDISLFEKNNRHIIHSFVGPYLVKRDFSIDDDLILGAIKKHTIGATEMNMVDKIIYIADKLEGSRNYDKVDYLRKLSKEDIDLCLLEVYKSNIIYVINRNYLLHPDTGKIWNYICGGYKNAVR